MNTIMGTVDDIKQSEQEASRRIGEARQESDQKIQEVRNEQEWELEGFRKELAKERWVAEERVERKLQEAYAALEEAHEGAIETLKQKAARNKAVAVKFIRDYLKGKE